MIKVILVVAIVMGVGLVDVVSNVRTVWAHSFVPKTFQELVSEAEVVFAGTVQRTQGRHLPSGLIVTDVTFSDLEVFHGSASAATIHLMVLGGTVGDETLDVAGFPRFEIGRAHV